MTQDQLNVIVTTSRCCTGKLGSKLVDVIESGDIVKNKIKMSFIHAMNMLKSLDGYDLTSECYSDDECCLAYEELSKICNTSCCSYSIPLFAP